MFSFASIPGAILGALHTAGVSRRFFDILFAVILVTAAVFLGIRSGKSYSAGIRIRPPRFKRSRRLIDAHGIGYEYEYNLALGLALSIGVGYISSFLGIGGGIIHVPALTFLLGFPIHIATATSHFILAIMALTGTVVHIVTGTFAHGVHRTIALAIGVVIGAQIGARLSEKVHGGWIIRALAIALALVGIRILSAAF
jgi:uncharacterized membrane protein YfcA